jgi:putative tryptophan/tyrosine transport system substrate-binding protein
MDRRAVLLALLATGAGFPGEGAGQQTGRSRRVVLFFGGTSSAAARQREVVISRLATHGFVSGRNLHLDLHRGGIGQWNLDAARAVIALQPDVIFVDSSWLARAMKETTAAIPIVFSGVDDPVEAGLVKSFARPGGNLTGVYFSQLEIATKRLQLLRELLPRARRVALAASFGDSGVRYTMPSLRETAVQLGFELIEIDGTWNFGFGPALQAAARFRPEAILVLQPYAIYGMEEVVQPLVRFAAERRIPSVFWESRMVELGAMFSYGANLTTELARAADQVARVLKGASPASLPVDQATQYELVVNAKTAKALGVKIPSSILVRADRVIE